MSGIDRGSGTAMQHVRWRVFAGLSDKSSALDTISVPVLKPVADLLVHFWPSLFNLSLTSSSVLVGFQDSVITPQLSRSQDWTRTALHRTGRYRIYLLSLSCLNVISRDNWWRTWSTRTVFYQRLNLVSGEDIPLRPLLSASFHFQTFLTL